MKRKVFKSLSFLVPSRFIKEKRFTKKDISEVKRNLVLSFGSVYLIASIVIALLVGSIFTFQNIETNNNYIGVYGLPAFIGSFIIVSGSITTIALTIISKLIQNKKISFIVCRISGIVIYTCAAVYMLSCIFSDAKMGFVTQSESLSAGIIFVAILLLIQQMCWIDAAVLDLGTSIGIVLTAWYCSNTYGMKAIYYYGLIALIYPFACYMIISLLFYAESQRYLEEMENERLHNRAYYDALTHCKNRHALTEFLKENKTRWESKENINLLIVLFDIDDFRLYNNQFSHLGGDYCLKSICDAIRNEFKSPNLDFFRYGGEEFLLFFELENSKEAPIYLERVRQGIEGLDITAPKGAPKDFVTISVGGLLLNNVKVFSFEEQMKVVDDYLYQAKASGKDVVCFNGEIIK